MLQKHGLCEKVWPRREKPEEHVSEEKNEKCENNLV